MPHDHAASTKDLPDIWSWGELFTLRVPPELAVTDVDSAVEFVPAHPETGEADAREASRAWLSVFSEDGAVGPGAPRSLAASFGPGLPATSGPSSGSAPGSSGPSSGFAPGSSGPSSGAAPGSSGPPSPVAALVRFAASHGVELPPDAVHTVLDRGVTWARVDFEARGPHWQAVAVAWNAHLALFLVAAAPGHDAFLAAMDQLLASWQPLDPVLAPPALPASDDDGF